MSNIFSEMELITESDVEQKFILKLLTEPLPIGLGYKNGDFKTKANIKRISIDKGNKKHLYFPDYAAIIDGLPLLIIEAKTPGSDLEEAMREARLYATEINASYPRNINPCERILATDGRTLLAGYWDSDDYIIEIGSEDFTTISPEFLKLTNFAAHPALTTRAREILGSIKSVARYFKPLHMLGGKAVINETVGDNSFGTNVSIEYKYLFNPDSPEDRASIVHHAYVTSKRKQAHVAPIDKLIRAAMPRNIVDAREIEDSRKPTEVLETVGNIDRVKNEICLLIGSVPPHLIARILLKGKRKYYSDAESNVKNLFASDDSDSLPNPFVRIAILQWLKNRAREYGPNRTLGFHQIATLMSDLQTAGYPEKSVIREIMVLTSAECIRSEAQTNEISPHDLVAIGPAGHVHLDLLRNINYLSTVAEDVLFRENQIAKAIADNAVGRGKFRTDSRQTAINNAALLTSYLTSYYDKYFLGEAKLVYSETTEQLVDIPDIELFVKQQVENDDILRNVGRLEAEYPVGSQLEAQIVSVQDYGIFVEFGLDGSGLVHKSNFNGVKVDTADALEAGDWVTVKILKYNHEHRKFDLKLIAVSDIHQIPPL